MPCFSQKCEKLPRSWGPPSLWMEDGQPKKMNHYVRILRLESEVRESRRVSTPVIHTNKIVFATEGKQVQTDMLDREAEVRRRRRCDHRIGWLRGKDTNTVLTRRNELLNVFVIPGQKYRPRARLVVLVTPECLECKSFRIGFTAGIGSTMR